MYGLVSIIFEKNFSAIKLIVYIFSALHHKIEELRVCEYFMLRNKTPAMVNRIPPFLGRVGGGMFYFATDGIIFEKSVNPRPVF